MRKLGILVIACGTSWLIGGCDRPAQEPAVGMYRATLSLPGGEAPIGLEVARESERYVLYLQNGAERTRVDNVRLENGELHAVFPGYENSLRVTVQRHALTGTVTLIKSGGKEQVIPFKATHGDTFRFYRDAAADPENVAGRWAVTLTAGDGAATPAVAVLEQQGDRVTGTVMTPTGDHRFLDGQIKGEELQLSTFAGGLAYLYKLRLTADGALEGDYWQGTASHSKVAGVRNAQVQLSSGQQTTLKDDTGRLQFTFRDVDGNEVSLSDARFRDKVVLVTLGGSWCPNCHDEAMFLVPFYRQYRDKGFEIVALMFERHGDFAKAAQAVRGYRKDLGIEFTTLVAGVSDTEQASQALPMLSGIYGYPTSIFVDKQGKVRKIHTGFTGPATGRHYEEYVAEFTALIDQLLAEPVGTATAASTG